MKGEVRKPVMDCYLVVVVVVVRVAGEEKEEEVMVWLR